jgi:MFS superfamily sulfate permease-like transporter
VLCSLLVPQGMAYAEIAGLPAITGDALIESGWQA